jgi:RHS repeat-associated protein
VITQEFDLLNQPLRITTRSEPDDGMPATSWFSYDASGNQVRVVSGEGRVVRREYDDRGRLFRTRRFAALLSDLPGDGAGIPQLDELHDQVVEFHFDLNGSILARRDRQAGDGGLTPRGDEQRSEYNGFDELVATRDEVCTRQVFFRDARGLEMVREIYGPREGPAPVAAVECAPSYPLLARREFRRDALGRVTMTLDDDYTHAADALAEPVPNPHGSRRIAMLAYNLRGEVERSADGRGRTRLFTYDGAGRMILRRLGEGNQVEGPVIVSKETGLRYNGGGRVSHWSIVEPGSQEGQDPREGSFMYDAAGGVIAISQSATGGAITETLERNSAGKVIRHVGATGAETLYSLDGLGRITALEVMMTAADGTPDTSFANPDGKVRWTYEYSPDGLLLAKIDARGQGSSWDYDGVGRVVTATYPDGRRWRTNHDPEGNPVSIQVRGPAEAGADPAPVVFAMEYDARNRPTRRTATLLPSSGLAATPSISREHDGLGRLTRILSEGDEQGRTAEVRRTYDSLGRLVAEDQTFLGVTHTLTAVHDNDDFRRELHLAGAGGTEMTTFFTADGLGRLARVEAPGRVVADYGYIGSGREISMDLTVPGGSGAPGFGLQRRASYDAAGRRDGLVYLDAATGQERAGFHRVLDPSGLPLSTRSTHLQAGPSGDQDQGLLLEHDSLGRLKRSLAGALSGSSLAPVIDEPTEQWEFVFDGAGNQAQVTRDQEVRRHGADEMNFYTVVDQSLDETGAWNGGTLQEKDLLGNLRREEMDGMAILYRHDAYGRLVGINKEVAATGQILPVASLTYDGLGRRLETDLAGGERRTWIYDDWRVVAEYGYAPGPLRDDPAAPADLLKALNVHGRALDEILYAERDLDGLPGLETALIPVTDLQGSTERLLDDQGGVVEVYAYEPFGLRRVIGAAGALAASAHDYRFGFTGQRHELFLAANRHLIHMRHRMYDPNRGRFLQPDPLGSRDDANLYAYVGNSPYRASDPLGLFGLDPSPGGLSGGVTQGLAARTGSTFQAGPQGRVSGLQMSSWRAAADYWREVSKRRQNEDRQYELQLRRGMHERRQTHDNVVTGAAGGMLAAQAGGDEPPPYSCPPGFLDCVTVSAGRPDSQLVALLDDEAGRVAQEEERIGGAQDDLVRHQAASSFQVGFSAEAIPIFFGFGFNLGFIVDSMGNYGVIVGGKSTVCCGLGATYGGYLGYSEGSMFMQRGAKTSVSATAATPWGGASYSHDAAGGDAVTLSLKGPSLLLSAGVEMSKQGIVAMSGTPPQAPPPAVQRPPGLDEGN